MLLVHGTLKYIDALTNSSAKRCTQSCRDLIPSALINSAGNECVRSCASGEFIDNYSDLNNPKCIASCSDATYKYKDALTDSSNPKCVSSCKLLYPSAVIKKDKTECVLNCASGEVIDGLTAPDNPVCTDMSNWFI